MERENMVVCVGGGPEGGGGTSVQIYVYMNMYAESKATKTNEQQSKTNNPKRAKSILNYIRIGFQCLSKKM